MGSVPERMSLHCSLCAWRTVTSRTADLWTRQIAALVSRHHVNMAAWSNDALISRARSVALSFFLDRTPQCDVLVWVDADITWRAAAPDYEGDLARIARSAYKTRGIVAGVYAKRMFGGGVAVRPMPDVGEFRTGTDRLLPAHAVSTGFMAIHRDGLDEIAKTLPYVNDDNGSYQPFCMPYTTRYDGALRYLSEDWALCMRAHDCGVPVHIDAMPILSHEGTHFFSVADGNKK